MSQRFEDIPFVPLPVTFQTEAAAFLTGAYAAHGAVFRTQLAGEDVVFLVGPEACRFVITSQADKFSHSEGWRIVTRMFGKGLLTMDGGEHALHRQAMIPAFTLSAIEPQLATMQRVIERYLALWQPDTPIDIYEEARHITFDVAAQTLVGMEADDDLLSLREMFLKIIDLSRIELDKDAYKREMGSLRAALFDLLTPMIKARRQHPGTDALSVMIRSFAAQDLPISDEQLIAHTNVLLLAGHETTTSLMTWVFYVLLAHPEYWRQAAEEQARILPETGVPTVEQLRRLGTLDIVMREAERLYPPIGNGPRRTTAEIEYNGYVIPAGTRVFYSIVATHYLPELYADPTRFDPTRFLPPREEHKTPYALLGFGGGVRTCLGMNFALLQIKLAVVAAMRRYHLRLLPDQEMVQRYRGLTGLPLHGLKVIATPI